jgi:hypothetical protein
MSKNVAASVRARLLNLAKERKEEFQFVLIRFGIERLLYRFSRSTHADEFVLKGATLFTIWSTAPHRPTKDVDMLGRGDPDPARLAELLRAVVQTKVEDDGLTFDLDSVAASRIREGEKYEGVRITLLAHLAEARINLQVDVGFGDAITPGPVEATFPTLLGHAAPVLKTYPRETVIAEKFQAMVDLGVANSRMKDFFDIVELAATFAFDGALLSQALRNTFERRVTELPRGAPTALTAEFHGDASKKTQWTAFLEKNRLDARGPSLSDAVSRITRFLMPLVDALVAGHSFERVWKPGGPWEERATAPPPST